MCLGIPGRVTSVHGEGVGRMGTVDFDGVSREVCLACAEDAVVGDYVMVHVGFAIATLDEAKAQRTLQVLREMGEMAELHEELGPES